MEVLACARCDLIVDKFTRSRTIRALPHHEYTIVGMLCPHCSNFSFVRRFTNEYILKEKHEDTKR
jgi:hypothetical protein